MCLAAPRGVEPAARRHRDRRRLLVAVIGVLSAIAIMAPWTARILPIGRAHLMAKAGTWVLHCAGRWNAPEDLPTLEVLDESREHVRVTIRTTPDREAGRIAIHRSVAIRSRRPYLLQFRGRADAARPLGYRVALVDRPDVDSMISGSVSLSSDWQRFSIPFDGRFDDLALLSFLLGESAISAEIDDVVIKPIEDVAPGEIVQWTLEVPRALGHRATFDRGTEPAAIMRIDPHSAPAAQPWAIQLLHRGESVRQGRRYTIDFEARADAVRPVVLAVGRAQPPFSNLGLHQSLEIGPVWKPYSVSFKATEDSRAFVAFQLAQAAAPVELRRVVWREHGVGRFRALDGGGVLAILLPPIAAICLLVASRAWIAVPIAARWLARSLALPATGSGRQRMPEARGPWPEALLPVLVASSIALYCLAGINRILVSDMVNFVRESHLADASRAFHVINPAYPLILSAIRLLAPEGARMFVLVALQQLAIVGAVWCVLRAGQATGRRGLALLAALLVALYIPIYLYAQTTQQEAFFVFFMAATTLYAVRSLTSNRMRDFVAAGALAGLSIAQRSTGVAAIAALVVVLIVASVPHRRRAFVCTVGGYALVIAAFGVKNYLQFGNGALVNGAGLHMFGRVAVVERWLPDTDASARLQRLGRENGFDDLFFPNAGWALLGPLAYRSRLGPFEADRLLHTVAIEALTARPWQTVVSSVRAMDRMVAPDNIKDAAQWAWLRPDGFDARQHAIGQVWHNDEFALYRALAEFTPHRSESSVSRWAEYVLAARIWTSRLWRGRWVILAMVAGGLYGVWRRDPFIVLFASMAFAQLGAAAFGDKPIGRYWDPAVPFLIPMLVFATGDIARRLRNRRVKTAV